MTIWTNARFTPDVVEWLKQSIKPDDLVVAAVRASNLATTGHDEKLSSAWIAFGQPDPGQVIDSPNLKWVHLTSAGYTRYDTDEFRSAMTARGGVLTNSSSVYDEPCAQHAAAMVLALARRLPHCLDDQRVGRKWLAVEARTHARRLGGQTVLIYGYGAIAKKLAGYLMAFGMTVTGVRRSPRGDEGIEVITPAAADDRLGAIDHVISVLPSSSSADGFFDENRIDRMGRFTLFYNIGRGATVHQPALVAALKSNRIAGAYLDVTTPEPLPADHELWSLPNCRITPHSAGGHEDEEMRLVEHFAANLGRYRAGATLLDRVTEAK